MMAERGWDPFEGTTSIQILGLIVVAQPCHADHVRKPTPRA